MAPTPIVLANGYFMPPIGLGTWQTDDEESCRKTIRTAVEIGYRFIDTAFRYKNEQFIGAELQKLLKEGVVTRESLFISTKLPVNGLRKENVEYFFKKSLKNLKLDYVDLYLIHAPVATKRTEDDYEDFPMKDGDVLIDPEVDLVETWKVMESLVDRGYVRSLGLSNFNSKQIQKIYDAARIKPVNLQVECHAYLPQYELHEFCKKLKMTMTAYSPLGSPGLPDFVKKVTGMDFKPIRLLDDKKLGAIVEKHGKTAAQVLLRYLIQREIIPIPKSANPERLKENFQVFDFVMDEEDDIKALKEMESGFRYFKYDFAPSMVNHPEQPFDIPF